MSYTRSYDDVVAELELWCASAPYTAGELEAMELNVGKCAAELRRFDIPEPRRTEIITRLHELKLQFQRIGGVYAGPIATHLAVCEEMHRERRPARCPGRFNDIPHCDENHAHGLACGKLSDLCVLCGKTNADHPRD